MRTEMKVFSMMNQNAKNKYLSIGDCNTQPEYAVLAFTDAFLQKVFLVCDIIYELVLFQAHSQSLSKAIT